MTAPEIPKTFAVSSNWLVTFLVGGVLHTGMMYQQFQQVRADQERNGALVAIIRENQIGGLMEIKNIKTELQTQGDRIVVIERFMYQQSTVERLKK